MIVKGWHIALGILLGALNALAPGWADVLLERGGALLAMLVPGLILIYLLRCCRPSASLSVFTGCCNSRQEHVPRVLPHVRVAALGERERGLHQPFVLRAGAAACLTRASIAKKTAFISRHA